MNKDFYQNFEDKSCGSQKLVQQQNQILELQTVLNRTAEELAELNKRYYSISKEIREIHNSKAWQVALLLRDIAKIFRAGFRLCKRIIRKAQKIIKRILPEKKQELPENIGIDIYLRRIFAELARKRDQQ